MPFFAAIRKASRAAADRTAGFVAISQWPRPARPRSWRGGVEAGQDQYPATGQETGQFGGGGQSVDTGQADVKQRHVRPVPQGRRHDLVAGGHRGRDLDARLQAKQRDQRVPHHSGILGDQHADHRGLAIARAGLLGMPGRCLGNLRAAHLFQSRPAATRA